MSAGNLLVQNARLCAVIDFGCTAVGDPACDLAIAWSLFVGESRQTFLNGLALDRDTVARGRGWALWKALITLAKPGEVPPAIEASQQAIAAVLADHRENHL